MCEIERSSCNKFTTQDKKRTAITRAKMASNPKESFTQKAFDDELAKTRKQQQSEGDIKDNGENTKMHPPRGLKSSMHNPEAAATQPSKVTKETAEREV
ncbi:hypothetical protein B0T17DRAFT_241305 [Bombardia bombarda]|uniref:Uncharacterized protein n=1 Tax=Bombardia bombarda TaxID=252184 RepID=A0AA39XC08_9PEZI|nr:hypothetical protein B0T17DRAFT_241305 [Bombardia bombarda]